MESVPVTLASVLMTSPYHTTFSFEWPEGVTVVTVGVLSRDSWAQILSTFLYLVVFVLHSREGDEAGERNVRLRILAHVQLSY